MSGPLPVGTCWMKSSLIVVDVLADELDLDAGLLGVSVCRALERVDALGVDPDGQFAGLGAGSVVAVVAAAAGAAGQQRACCPR